MKRIKLLLIRRRYRKLMYRTLARLSRFYNYKEIFTLEEWPDSLVNLVMLTWVSNDRVLKVRDSSGFRLNDPSNLKRHLMRTAWAINRRYHTLTSHHLYIPAGARQMFREEALRDTWM